ncbi:MAG: hypothetical protein U0835_16940 [Isosphaeraceae bacterium]
MTAGACGRFYKSKSRLSTEHALLDDNGDGLGTPPTGSGASALETCPRRRGRRPPRAPDPPRAERARRSVGRGPPARDRLEIRVAALRDQKSASPEDQYYARSNPS